MCYFLKLYNHQTSILIPKSDYFVYIIPIILILILPLHSVARNISVNLMAITLEDQLLVWLYFDCFLSDMKYLK